MRLAELIDFFAETNKLKYTMRYSSCPQNIRDSSAAHSWQVALMVPLIAQEINAKINVQHATEIALVHDLAENALKEDFDSFLLSNGTLNEKDKDESEKKEMNRIKNKYDFGEKIYSLWKEYEENKTPEAKFVKALDKIESHLHIIERGGSRENALGAEHQALYADKAVSEFPELKPLLKEAKKKLKPLLEKQGLKWKNEYDYPE
jgi:putative hydrolase of HD superfamily